MWIYKGEELGVEGIIGVPNRDMTDEEFVEASGKINLQFPDQLGALERSGLWEHVSDRENRLRSKDDKEEEQPRTSVVNKVEVKKEEVEDGITGNS